MVDDEQAKYLEKTDGSYHSYTFKAIDPDHPEDKKNLVLSLKADGTYKEILINYYLTQEDMTAYQESGVIDFDTNITATVISEDVFSVDVYSKVLAPTTNSNCIEFEYNNGTRCTGNNRHSWEERFDCDVWLAVEAGIPTNYSPPTQGPLSGIIINQACIGAGDPEPDLDEGSQTENNDSSGGNGDTNGDNDDYDPTDPDIHGNGSGDDDPVFAPELEEDTSDPSHEDNC